MLTPANVIDAGGVAVLAYVLHTLFEDGQFLAAWGRVLSRIEWEYPNAYKMLGGCLRCFTGQIALWSGFFLAGVNPFKLAVFIALSIFFSDAIKRYAGSTGKV